MLNVAIAQRNHLCRQGAIWIIEFQTLLSCSLSMVISRVVQLKRAKLIVTPYKSSPQRSQGRVYLFNTLEGYVIVSALPTSIFVLSKPFCALLLTTSCHVCVSRSERDFRAGEWNGLSCALGKRCFTFYKIQNTKLAPLTLIWKSDGDRTRLHQHEVVFVHSTLN